MLWGQGVVVNLGVVFGCNEIFFLVHVGEEKDLLAEAWQLFQPSCLQKSGAFSAGVCEFQVSSLCH